MFLLLIFPVPPWLRVKTSIKVFRSLGYGCHDQVRRHESDSDIKRCDVGEMSFEVTVLLKIYSTDMSF